MSPRLASLPMYDIGGAATAAFWQGLKAHLIAEGLDDVPETLVVPADYDSHWLEPALLLSQTCGYPLRRALAGRVQYVGTPSYDAPGVDDVFYRSAIVVRADDAARLLADVRGRRVAFNSTTSQSGYNGFRDIIAPHAINGRFFSRAIETGSHSGSLRAVIAGEADVAAIDAVTLAGESEPIRAAIRIIDWTRAVPSLPLITSLETSPADLARLRRGIAAALADPSLARARRALMLVGFTVLPPDFYDAIVAMEQRAVALGYPALV